MGWEHDGATNAWGRGKTVDGVFFCVGRRSESDGRVRSLVVFVSVSLLHVFAIFFLGGPFTRAFRVLLSSVLSLRAVVVRLFRPWRGSPPASPPLLVLTFSPSGSYGQVLAGYLMFGTVSGIMMALFLDNVGGAWDNAKKYVEVMTARFATLLGRRVELLFIPC